MSLTTRATFWLCARSMLISGCGIPIGTETRLTSLCHFVVYIVLLRSKEQVVRPNTLWIITLMENIESFRNLANKQPVSNPVSTLFTKS